MTQVQERPATEADAVGTPSVPDTRARRAPRGAGRVSPLVLAPVSLLLMAACLLQQRGKIIQETKLDLALDPGRWLAQTFHLWIPTSQMGFVQNQAAGYLFPMGAFYWLAHQAGMATWVIQRTWMGVVLVAAFWGAVRLADELEIGAPAARVVTGVAYSLSPFFVDRVGNTSGLVLGGALLPWMIVPLVRASRGASLRRCGLASGVAVLAAGGINAAVTLAVLLGPLAWLLTRRPGPERRRLGFWWIVGCGLAVLWWLVPLAYQARYGFDFLPYTETATTTTSYASNIEIVRGVADWLQYLNLGSPWIRSGWILVSDSLPIIATGGLAAAGLYGLCRRDLPHRRFIVLGFLLGVAVMAAGYGTALGNPAHGLVRDMLTSPGGMFRNVYKFQPVVLLFLSLGVAHSTQLGLDRLRRRAGSARRVARTGLRRTALWARVVVLGVVGLVVVVGAAPVWKDAMTTQGGFSSVPSWWDQLASWQSHLPAASRVLLVPGGTDGQYSWGNPEDEPFSSLATRPFAVRDLVSYGSATEARMLDAIDAAIARGGDPGLPAFLARAGFSYVVARDDYAWQRWNDPDPSAVNQALQASGLVPATSFGPRLSQIPGLGAGLDTSLEGRSLHALQVYAVPGAGGLVQTYPTGATVQVAGDPQSLLDMIDHGLLRPDQATVLAGDVPAGIPAPAGQVVSDTLRRQVIDPGLTNTNRSYTLQPGQTSVGPGSSLGVQFLSFPASGHEATAHFTGDIAGVTASSYGSWLYQLPELQPAHAVDGEPGTAWVAGPNRGSTGQWLQVNLTHPIDVHRVRVQLLEDGPWRPSVTALRITTARGSVVDRVRPDQSVQQLRTPTGTTGYVRVTFASVTHDGPSQAGAGIRELSIPGVSGRRVIVDPPASSSGSSPPTFDFNRWVVDPHDPLRSDPETAIVRQFTSPSASTDIVTGYGAPVDGAALLALVDQAQAAGQPGGAQLSVTASSTYQDLPAYRAANVLDPDPLRGWAPRPTTVGSVVGSSSGQNTARHGPLRQSAPAPAQVDTDPTLTFRWSGARTIDRIGIQLAQGFSRPASLLLVSPAGDRRVTVLPGGTLAPFAPLTTDQLAVHFQDIHEHTVPSSLGPAPVPIGIRQVEIPGVTSMAPAPLSATAPITVPCAAGPTASVDGQTIHFSVSTTLQQLDASLPVAMTACGSPTVALSAGTHDLSTTAGAGAFNLDGITLAPAPAPALDGAAAATTPTGATSATTSSAETAAEAAPTRTARVVHWGAESRRIQLGPGGATYLTVDETRNAGWKATWRGQTLRPVTIDGWRQGFLVPSGPSGAVRLSYTPEASYRVALIAGLALAGLLLVLVLVPSRRRSRRAVTADTRQPPWWLAVVALGAFAVWIGGWMVLVVPPLVVLAGGPRPWMGRRLAAVAGRGSVLRPWLAVVAVLTAAVVVSLQPGRVASEGAGAFGWPAQAAATVAIVAVAAGAVATAVPGGRRRRRAVTPQGEREGGGTGYAR